MSAVTTLLGKGQKSTLSKNHVLTPPAQRWGRNRDGTSLSKTETSEHRSLAIIEMAVERPETLPPTIRTLTNSTSLLKILYP